jgi:hypothetical protein
MTPSSNFNSVAPQKENKFWGYVTVLTGFCIHIFLGNLYLWGNISAYVVSYYHFKGDADATMRSAVVCLPISFTM